MKDLNKLFNECLEEVKNAGIEPGNIVSVTINTRAKKRFGQCKYNSKTRSYSINISNELLKDNVPINSPKETIIHEIIHTCNGCMNHGKEWNRLVNIMNREYGYHISRCSTYEEKGIEAPKPRDNKYEVTCVECGAKWLYKRWSKVCEHPSSYRCHCGGKLKVKSLTPDVTIYSAAHKVN